MREPLLFFNGGKMDYQAIISEINDIAENNEDNEGKLQSICDYLKDNVDEFDWVGFYLTDRTEERMLVLGPFAGAPTEHVRIGFGQGICGQAADTKQTFIIQDVSKENNYLSCSIDVQSEIVVPVMRNGEILGELDIDSHMKAPFTDEHRKLLEEVAQIASGIIV